MAVVDDQVYVTDLGAETLTVEVSVRLHGIVQHPADNQHVAVETADQEVPRSMDYATW